LALYECDVEQSREIKLACICDKTKTKPTLNENKITDRQALFIYTPSFNNCSGHVTI